MASIAALIFLLALLVVWALYGRLRLAHREQTRAMAVLQRLADERQARIAELAAQLDTQTDSLSTAQRALEQRQSTLASRDAELERAEARLSALETELATRQTRIDALMAESATYQASIAALQAQNLTHQSNLEALRQHLHTQEDGFHYKIALALTLANSAYDALLIINEGCRVIASNAAAEILFDQPQPIGRQLAELTGTPALELMVESVLANEEEIYEEQLTLHERFYRVRAQVIRRDGNLFIGLALQDVTELVRLNRARRDMVANISHELRTPIANIRLIIDGLFHDQDKPKRKESISSLRAIARETDNLLWLVQEMADLSMIESGQAIVRMVDVPLPDIVTEAVERLSDQIDSKHITMIQDIPAHLRVLCDRDLTQRVLVNLLHNAMKWSPSGGVISISASDNGEDITMRVVDSGPGVPDDQVERIFERFYQVDASRSGNEGTGLGLAICRHIVVAHGGQIWAEGNQGGTRPGGRFLFTLLNSALDALPEPLASSNSDTP